MKKKHVILLHILFWMYFIFQMFIHFNTENHSFGFGIRSGWYAVQNFFFSLLYVFVFYSNYLFVLPRYLLNKNKFKTIAAGLGLLAFFIIFRYILEEKVLLMWFGRGNYKEGYSMFFYIYDNLYYGSRPIISSTIIWFFINLKQIQKEKIRLIEENKSAEINFLKSQINPHFIFNTLNNIYYLVYQKSEKSLEAIEKLSSLMRYVTYESQRDLIALRNEIQYIEDFIDLESMRVAGKIQLIFNKKIINGEVQIPPLLLIPFIENVFKHAVLDDPKNPLIIDLIQDKGQLRLIVKNKIAYHQKDKQGGVGIDNVRRRLALYYPDRHQLFVQQENDYFRCELTLDL